MTIKVNPDGSFEAATPEEAVALSKLIRQSGGAVSNSTQVNGKSSLKPAAVSKFTAPDLKGFSDWVLPSAIKFLETIDNPPTGGANADAITAALGADNPKGLGGRTAAVNKLLETCGFVKNHVYSRTSDGKVWRGNAKLNEALKALKAMRATQFL